MPTNDPLGMGSNNPPLKEQMEMRHSAIFERLAQLLDAAREVPPKITAESEASRAQDLVKMMRVAIKQADATRDAEKEPYADAVKQINATFKKPMEALDAAMRDIISRYNNFLEEKKAAEDAAETFKPVLAKLKEALKDKAEDVRVTSRLVDSPACLVVTDDGMSMQLARMLKQAGQQAPEVKPVLEVNPEHALVKKLDGSVHFHDLAHILFDQALLAEGGLPADPAAYVKRVNALLS